MLATAMGGPVAGALAGGAIGMYGARQQARGIDKATQQAGQTALGGFNYLSGSPIGQQYLPAGGNAVNMQANLLGLGEDPAAAQAAYENYLNSVGFQGQMQAGQQAITSSAAARGLLGSGSTAKALTRYGHQLGQQNFNNYLGQLGGVAGMGLQAGGMLGQSAAQGYGQAAQMQFTGGVASADARRDGWDQMAGGLGDAHRAWQRGRQSSQGSGGPPSPFGSGGPAQHAPDDVFGRWSGGYG
jgi:hypothetical protein